MVTSGGTIDVNLSRDPNNRIKYKVSNVGKSSVTHYRVLKKFPGHSLIGLRLETGRTHQIRIHMSHLRHAILGDPLYGQRLMIPKGASENLKKILRSFKRQALHACQLTFQHPSTAELTSFSSKLPEDMESIIKELSGNELDADTINNLKYPEIKT